MRKAIILDYDGVIVDSFKNTFLAYQEIFREAGKEPIIKIGEFHQWYDAEWHNNFRRLNIPLSGSKFQRCIDFFKEIIQNNSAPLYLGIDGVLEELSEKYALAIVSSNYKEEIEKRLDDHNISKFFTTIISHIEGVVKPNPKQFLIAMKKLAVSPNEVASVGDIAKDVLAARNANITEVISVTYGWEKEEVLRERLKKLNVVPTTFVDSPKKLLEYFK